MTKPIFLKLCIYPTLNASRWPFWPFQQNYFLCILFCFCARLVLACFSCWHNYTKYSSYIFTANGNVCLTWFPMVKQPLLLWSTVRRIWLNTTKWELLLSRATLSRREGKENVIIIYFLVQFSIKRIYMCNEIHRRHQINILI